MIAGNNKRPIKVKPMTVMNKRGFVINVKGSVAVLLTMEYGVVCIVLELGATCICGESKVT